MTTDPAEGTFGSATRGTAPENLVPGYRAATVPVRVVKATTFER